VQDKEDAETLPEIKGGVDFENVTFGYNPEIPVLKNFNLHVSPGECIGLVGPTGAGKSTVINLISRFYDVQQGAVKIDGHDVKDVTLHSLRAQMGIMMQDTFIFKGFLMTYVDRIISDKLF
jgi:ATP-binding cassette subfamily B protein